MSTQLPESADARNNFEDLSGVSSAAHANPYDALLEASGNDPVETPFSHSQVNISHWLIFPIPSLLEDFYLHLPPPSSC